MISLVLPYWERLAAAQAAMRELARCYAGFDLEVIVVDDGSPHPFAAPMALPFELRVIRLEAKREPKNPCVPLNAGIRAARGEFIALSGVEMLHSAPVLPAMRDAVRALGARGYVTAACRSEGRWHSHSSLLPLAEQGVSMPARAHYHFMSMGHAALIQAVLFDEDYRDGAGYDDPDFLLRLQRAGAAFDLRDELIVSHPRKDARSAWRPEMFERNRRLFVSKWRGA